MIVKTAATAAVATGLVFGGAVGAQALDNDSLEVEHSETAEQMVNALNYPVTFTLADGEEITIESDEELGLALEEHPELSDDVLAQIDEPSIILLLLDDEGTEPIAPIDPDPEPVPDPEPQPDPEPEVPIAPIPDPEPEPDPEPVPDPTPAPSPVVPGKPVTPAPKPVVNPSVGYTVQPVASTATPSYSYTPTQLAYTGAASTAGVAGAALALLGGGAAMLFRKKRKATETE